MTAKRVTTTRAPGLTAAMRAALETRQFSDVMFKRAQEMGFIDEFSNYYPRATAALAAPRMTKAELAMLERIAGGNLLPVTAAISVIRGWRLTRSRLQRRGFIAFVGGTHATPAGLTALNNMRAAMGSAEYKETA